MFNLFVVLNCKITDTERKCIMRKHGQNHMSDSMEPLAKKRFLENKKSIQLWVLQIRKNHFPNAVRN